MVSVSLWAARIPPSQPIFRSRTAPRVPLLPFTTSRFQNTVRLQVKQRLFTTFASNSNPSGGDSLSEKSDGTKAGDAGQGPPFLTILAGFLVFLLVCWIVGSIVLWLISLIVKLPPSK